MNLTCNFIRRGGGWWTDSLRWLGDSDSRSEYPDGILRGHFSGARVIEGVLQIVQVKQLSQKILPISTH
jgi:hypothetical protein